MELKTVSKWLVVLGAINWGLVGLLDLNLVGALVAGWPVIVKIIYLLIGAAGLWGAYAMLTNKKKKR
ncbi:MAG TPA: DUF378 domain-containing protein [Patescibacteria group bacterium]